MYRKPYVAAALSGAVALCGVAFSANAHAALVEYDFEAEIDAVYGSEWALSRVGVPTEGPLTGSFSYDTEVGYHLGGLTFATEGVKLDVHELDRTGGSRMLSSNAYSENLGIAGFDRGMWFSLYLPGQDISSGSLPTTLSLQDGATLRIGVGPFRGGSVMAGLTSLNQSGTAVPELDPGSGAASLALVFGGLAMFAPRRRRRAEAA